MSHVSETIPVDQTATQTPEFMDADGIDLSQPLYEQVAGLGDQYFEWVHDPIRKATIRGLQAREQGRWSGSVRIFRADWLEAMTHISWRLVLAIWLPVVVVLPASARVIYDQGWGLMATMFVAGIAVWTLVEYVLHRWCFHTPPRGPRGIRAHFLAHGIHHFDPYDGSRLVFPPLLGVGIAVPLFILFELLFPTGIALTLISGLLAGYLIYDMSHFISHHGSIRVPWFRFLHRYHKAHHHREHNAMFGVSSPLWDLVFRTGSRNVRQVPLDH